MLNSNSHRISFLLFNYLTIKLLTRLLRQIYFPGAFYKEPYPTLAAPSALKRPWLGACGILPHGGRTPYRVSG